MDTNKLKLYLFLSRFPLLQKSYSLQVIAIACLGSLIPLLTFIMYVAIEPSLDLSHYLTILIVVAIATCLGIGLVVYLLNWLLFPIHLTSSLLHQYLNEEKKELFHIPTDFETIASNNAVGQLIIEVQYLINKLDLLNHSQKKGAIFDPLTGVPNYRVGKALLHLDIARARREKKSVLVVLIEVSNLKEINRQFGHQTGDIVLIQVAGILSNSIRESDWIARWDENRFLMVLWNFHDATPTIVFMRIQQKTILIPVKDLSPICLTIGAHEYEANRKMPLKKEVETLLVKAEEHLSEVKENKGGELVLNNYQCSTCEALANCTNQIRQRKIDFC
jgi:diguanylate cyclase (GGDEF)-like protein